MHHLWKRVLKQKPNKCTSFLFCLTFKLFAWQLLKGLLHTTRVFAVLHQFFCVFLFSHHFYNQGKQWKMLTLVLKMVRKCENLKIWSKFFVVSISPKFCFQHFYTQIGPVLRNWLKQIVPMTLFSVLLPVKGPSSWKTLL